MRAAYTARRGARRPTGHALLLIGVGAAGVALALLPGTNPRLPMTVAVRAGFAIMGFGAVAAGVAYWRVGFFTRPFNAALGLIFLGMAVTSGELYARSGSAGYAVLAGLAVFALLAALMSILPRRARVDRHKP